MFWNRFPFLRTVKFKIALSYAALLLISFLVVFCIVFFHLASANRYEADTLLNALFQEIEYEYLTGTEPGPGKNPVRRLDKVPPEIYREIEAQQPGFIPLLAFRDTENRAEYTLFGKSGGKLFQVDADRRPLKVTVHRIDFVDRSAEIAAALAGETFGNIGKPDFHLLLTSSGRLIARSPFHTGELPFLMNRTYRTNTDQIQYETIESSRHRIRLAYRRLFNGELLVLGTDLHAADATLKRAVVTFFWTGVAVFLVSAFTGWFLARRMFTGIDRVGRTARKIAAGDYSLRVAAGNEGLEVENLVADFNFMVDNTETLMEELRTISDNIAHDLRTPLTRMLACADVTFAGDQTLAAYRDAMADNADECRRMLHLVNTMLEITQTGSGATALRKEEFDFSDLMKRSGALYSMAAEQKRQSLVLEIPEMPVLLYADRTRILQVVGNLLDNAVKFTPEGGEIRVTLSDAGEAVILTVRDNGCGIRNEDQPLVFRRFFRADGSRNLPGNGLGLSLVLAVLHAHGGSIHLQSEIGKGSCFTVRIPKPKPEPPAA